MLSAVAAYKNLDSLLPKRTEVYSKNKLVQKDIEYMRSEMKKVTSLDDFMKNYKLLQITLTAFGLESEINKRGYIKKILEGNIGDEKALVNRVADDRWRDLATTLLFSTGTAAAKADSTLQTLEDKLIKIGVEKELDDQAPGVRAAITFKETADAGKIKTVYNLLSNPVLTEVIFGARNLPQTIRGAQIESQARTIEQRVDIERLSKDPKYVDQIIQQYLVSQDVASSQNGDGPGSSVAGLLAAALSDSSGYGLQLSVDMFT